jgi:hypothetical protein
MANEISVSASLSASKNGATIAASDSLSITMAGDQMISNVQIVPAASEAILLGDVTTPGYVYIKNLDPVNFVSISVLATAVAGTSFAKLLPGQFCVFPAVSTTLTAIADTLPCNVQVVVIEL